ncbi:MAG TPA: iron-sulfur cluster repair di-iron protein [Acidimicrobiales bacterium]|nr:iron-sulfur cluster repair di-iron protein [Acidimicrobiales bacterium]
MTTTTDQTLGDLVTARPAAARILERHGLDYCCGGDRPLTEACDAAGVDVGDVVADLDELAPGDPEAWAALPPPGLAADIVATHHAYLHEELPLLDALADKVLRVHGDRHPELAEVRRLVAALAADLAPHLLKEERVLFPAIALLAEGHRDFPFGSIAAPITMMLAEHDRAGELLAALRAATGAYRPPADACASYRSLYERLDALEADTHLHVHKENNVLFPAVLRLAEA